MGKGLFKTELEALIACRNHWYVMWITGSSDKCEYKPSSKWDNNCACCKYANETQGKKTTNQIAYCKACPLAGYAWEVYCVFSGQSFYEDWCESKTPEQRQFYAGRIVYSCNQAIEDYLLNKKED